MERRAFIKSASMVAAVATVAKPDLGFGKDKKEFATIKAFSYEQVLNL